LAPLLSIPLVPYRVLYLSHLASDRDFSVVGPILHVSRERNQQLGIHGVLVFDGARFCQLLEGRRPEVTALVRRIRADTRHTSFRVLFEGEDAQVPLQTRWRNGYCEPDDLDLFEDDSDGDPARLLAAFVQRLPAWDLSA